jgi:hypothetical protein
MLIEPITLGDDTSAGLIPRRLSSYASDKSLHLNSTNLGGNGRDKHILSNINSPRTPSDELGDENTLNNEALRVRSDYFIH